jgi:hypothetical protein
MRSLERMAKASAHPWSFYTPGFVCFFNNRQPRIKIRGYRFYQRYAFTFFPYDAANPGLKSGATDSIDATRLQIIVSCYNALWI